MHAYIHADIPTYTERKNRPSGRAGTLLGSSKGLSKGRQGPSWELHKGSFPCPPTDPFEGMGKGSAFLEPSQSVYKGPRKDSVPPQTFLMDRNFPLTFTNCLYLPWVLSRGGNRDASQLEGWGPE